MFKEIGVALVVATMTQPVRASTACPQTAAAWTTFRDSAALTIVRQSAHRASDDPTPVNDAIREIDSVFAKCVDAARPILGVNPELAASLANLKTFSSARKNEGLDHWLMGFNVPDAKYFADTSSFTAIPQDLQNPKLLSALSDPKRIPEALKMLEALNATYSPEHRIVFFQYVSQHLTTPDQSQVYGRILIYVPADAAGIERWVQFGVPEAGKGRTQNVSVVAVKTNANGQTDVYFKDHFRMYDRAEIYIKSRFEVNGSGDSCVACHKSGVLPIFPKPGSLAAADQPKLDFVNSVFKNYGPPSFGGYLDSAALGPALGETDAETRAKRTPEFIATCAKDLKFDDIQNSHATISKSMNCAKCHNSADGLGSLNYPLNLTVIDSYVRGGKMPPRNTLSVNEREGLLRCLKAEYFGVDSRQPALLLNWLKGVWSEVF